MREHRDSFIVKAPTRVDLAGGTLDLWPMYCLLGHGRTINIALDLFASIEFRIVPAPKLSIEVSAHRETFSFSQPVTGESLSKVPAAVRFPVCVISQYLLKHTSVPNIEMKVQIKTDAPMGSGLGGSSTLCVALAKGLARVFSEYTDPDWRWDMLDWVRDVEAHYLKLPTGVQDYLAALFGGGNCFYFGMGARERVAYPPNLLSELGSRMMVIFSGESHHSGKSNWDVFKGALEGNQSILEGFRRIQAVADDLDTELRKPVANWKRIGELMSQEWKIRRELFEVHTPRLDEIVTLLTQQGVLGVKVCGAAQGGSLVVLINAADREKIATVCRQAKVEVLKTQPAANGVAITPL